MDLSGQNILVTGASKGIGKAIGANILACGAALAIHYNSDKRGAEDLSSQFGQSKTGIFQANLSDSQQVIELFKDTLARFGHLDTIILNAGIFPPQSLNSSTEEWFSIWKDTMAINLDAVGILTKLGIEHFKQQGKGRFIYIGSRAAFRGETENYLAYAASKGGITSLAKSVARSFGKYNITAFVIAPGFTRTKMAEEAILEIGEATVLDEIALNKLTTPEDIAPLVSLLCSGQLDHATGTTIDINAGSYIR